MFTSLPLASPSALLTHASAAIAAPAPAAGWTDLGWTDLGRPELSQKDLSWVDLSRTDRWSQVAQRAEPAVLVSLWPALVILLLTLAWPPAHRWGRTLVTVVHEVGHAAVGILVGRRFWGFVVSKDLSGHAVTAGKPRGLGRVLTTWASYPAPALLGAAVVAAALRGWSGVVLSVGLVMLLVLLVMSRSLRTVGVVLAVGALATALWWLGGSWRAGVLAGVGLVMLVGAWGSLGDVARSADPHQDHGTLAQLTHLPGWLWLCTWFLADAAATAWVGWLAWGLMA